MKTNATAAARGFAGPALGAVLLVLVGCFALIASHALIADETFHLDQIQRFLRGEFRLNPAITQIPAYHAAVAWLAMLTGRTSIPELRFISLVFGFCTVIVFHRAAATVSTKGATLRTVQLAALPILFPYFFLLYTDVASLLFVLLAMLKTLRNRPVSAAAFAGIAILVRQNNIVWAGFLWMLFLFEEQLVRITIPRSRNEDGGSVALRWTWRRGVVRQWIAKTWPFLVVFAAFGIFTALNGGVSLGDREAHPFPSFHLGNVWFLLFLFCFLFLPLHAEMSADVFKRMLRAPLGTFAGFVALAAVFFMTFANDHPDNGAQYWFFLRNRLLVFFTTSPWIKAAFLVPIAFSTLLLTRTRFERKHFLLLLPVTFVFLSGSWLIEQRYTLIPLALFLLLRERGSARAEWMQAAFSALCSGILFAGILRGDFFL